MNKKKIINLIWPFVNFFPFNNRFIGKLVIKLKKTICIKNRFQSKGKNNKVFVGENSYLKGCKFFIKGDNNIIKIGKNVVAFNTEFWIEDNNNTISIGDRTYIAGKTHLACIESTSIKIGCDCLFSSDIVIRTGDSHSIIDLYKNRINPSQNVSISDHVWICHDVKINKGVMIQENCVVGTGSIVNKQFDKTNTILAGVPAKIVKENVNWDSQRLKYESKTK